MKKYSQSWSSLRYKGRKLDCKNEFVGFMIFITTLLIFQTILFTLIP